MGQGLAWHGMVTVSGGGSCLCQNMVPGQEGPCSRWPLGLAHQAPGGSWAPSAPTAALEHYSADGPCCCDDGLFYQRFQPGEEHSKGKVQGVRQAGERLRGTWTSLLGPRLLVLGGLGAGQGTGAWGCGLGALALPAGCPGLLLLPCQSHGALPRPPLTPFLPPAWRSLLRPPAFSWPCCPGCLLSPWMARGGSSSKVSW